MCWIDYYPVIPEGCMATEQHIAMRKRVSPCSKVFAAGFHAVISQQTSEAMEEKINKTLFKMYQASVTASSYNAVPPTGASVFDFCPPEKCKVIESYHRELCMARLQTRDPYCPVCKGEVGKYESLMVCFFLWLDFHFAIISARPWIKRYADKI